jgi:hypothetical protein
MGFEVEQDAKGPVGTHASTQGDMGRHLYTPTRAVSPVPGPQAVHALFLGLPDRS